MRSAYRVEPGASEPPNPRLIACGPSSGNDSRRFHRTMLEAPMKTMAFCGGGVTVSASSNFLIAGSHRSAWATAAWAATREATREAGTRSSARTPSTKSHVTPTRIRRSTRCVIRSSDQRPGEGGRIIAHSTWYHPHGSGGPNSLKRRHVCSRRTIMQDSEGTSRRPVLGRRNFLQTAAAAGAGAGLGALTTLHPSESAAQTPLHPWWNARPANANANRPVAIDLHAHWVPPPYAKAMADLGRPLGNPFPLELDIDQRRKWMDEHGVQMHVLTLNGGMPWQIVTPQEGERLAQIVNDAGVEAHAAFPDRYIASIELPIRDAAAAVKELNRVAGKPGLRAVHLPDSIDNRDYLFQLEFAPLLARIEELGYPILFHNLNSDLFGKRAADAGLDNTFAHAVLAAKFISTGTLDKFPRLEIVLPHPGGAFPYVAGRLEHFQDHMAGDRPKPQRPYKTYVRRFHYDYLTYHPEGLRFLLHLVRPHRILVGPASFNPKDIEDPSAAVDQFKLPAADRGRILHGNAIRLFRL